MIRQVTFGFLISMMSSCLSLEYYTLPARAVGRLAFVRMCHLPHCSCCTTTDFYRRIVKIVWCWGPLTVQDLLVKFTKMTEVLIVIYSITIDDADSNARQFVSPLMRVVVTCRLQKLLTLRLQVFRFPAARFTESRDFIAIVVTRSR